MRTSIALSYNPYLRLWHEWFSFWHGMWFTPLPADNTHVFDISVDRSDAKTFTAGDSASLEHIVDLPDVEGFATLTGDTNPVHLDPDYARESKFGERIAHGMYTASFFGTLFGTALPGPGAIYVSQALDFKAPVKLGDIIRARVQLQELLPKGRARFVCTATVGDRVVLTGVAVLMLPR